MKNNKQFDLSGLMNLLGSTDQSAKKQAADAIKSNLNAEENKQLEDILHDRSKIDAILKSEAARQILRKINGNSDGKLK